MSTAAASHCWQFYRAGGSDQVRLERGEDFAALRELDQKLWVALSCPVDGVELDAGLLHRLDSDGDGHIRAPELLAAIDWLNERVRTLDVLLPGRPEVALADLRDDTAAGQALLQAVRHLLDSLDRHDAPQVTLDDVRRLQERLCHLQFNGDGIVPVASTGTPALGELVSDMLATLGGQPDRSGEPGVDAAIVRRFFAEAQDWLLWWQRPGQDEAVCPLGERTAAAWQALTAVQAKVEDYFTRCRLAGFDSRAATVMNGSEDQLRALASLTLADAHAGLAELPLAQVSAQAVLPLHTGLNPAWEAAIRALHDAVVVPLLGEREHLTRTEWQTLLTRLAPYAEWQRTQPVTPVASLGAERLQHWLESGLEGDLQALAVRDAAVQVEFDALEDVERLLCYLGGLAQLARNFVSFADFYSGQGLAAFQAGTLYLDGRSCELCVHVLDSARHAQLASLSGVYLAYCDCTRGGDKMTIAAAFTAGDADQLMVGRNGVFYDRQGRDWDATVVRIIDHPISLRQAFWAPYRKASRLLAEQLQKLAASKGRQADDMLTRSVTQATDKVVAAPAAKPAAAPPAPFDVAKFAGIFAALGLAVGALGTALASLVSSFLALKLWQMPLAVAGLMLLVSGPSLAMAYFKLRNRNLGPILDANGWAVNARARINIPFGTTLTRLASLPAGAERSLVDPYAERSRPWGWYLLLITLVVAAVIAWGWR